MTTPLRAIRAKCVDCCGGSKAEPKTCTAQGCPLWAFRSGHNPNRKKPAGAAQASEKAEQPERKPKQAQKLIKPPEKANKTSPKPAGKKSHERQNQF